MGKTIERIARERGHEIVSIIDVDNQDDFASEAFASADVAIEFTAPSVAISNYRKAWAAGVAVVSGTTGWNAHLDAIKQEIADNNYTLFWTSNFSLGVNLFFELNRQLAKMMNRFPSYNVELTEIHHTQKLDAPSGTAITLAEGMIAQLDRKNRWVLGNSNESEAIGIHAIREGMVPGTHTIRYESEVDNITITHEAKNREGLALGAVLAAEYTQGKKGFLSMSDMLEL